MWRWGLAPSFAPGAAVAVPLLSLPGAARVVPLLCVFVPYVPPPPAALYIILLSVSILAQVPP